MNRPTPSNRGWSLIEMVVAISLISVVFGLVTTFLVQLTRQHDSGQQLIWESLALGRLANQFRADVYQATDVERGKGTGDGAEHDTIRCELPDGRDVRYELEPDRLVRRAVTGPGETAQEVYRLPRQTQVELALSSDERVTIATLVLRYPVSSAPGAKQRQLPITATVGRELKWRRADADKESETD